MLFECPTNVFCPCRASSGGRRSDGLAWMSLELSCAFISTFLETLCRGSFIAVFVLLNLMPA